MEIGISNALVAGNAALAVSILVKATAIAALGLVGTRIARRGCASLRHVLLASTFASLAVLPFASAIIPTVAIEARVTVPEPEQQVAPPARDLPTGALPSKRAAAQPATTEPSSLPISELLVGAWITGATLFLLPVAIGLWQTRSVRRTALPWAVGQSTADTLVDDAGIRRRVDVLLHEAAAGPMTCGVIHPAILLPPDARTWKPADLARAIVHELEHVKRLDWLTHGLARAVCAVYWFHPLVWSTWRRLSLEAERACDDAVLRQSETTDYASQLVELAERLSSDARIAFPAMANRADLAARVRSVLDGRQRRGRVGALATTASAVVAIAVALTISPLRLVSAAQLTADSSVEAVRFEVATIKPTAPDVRGTTVNIGQQTVLIKNWPVRWYIGYAYHIHGSQLIGGTDWASDDRFDVTGKYPKLPDGKKLSGPENLVRARTALRALLEERFQLKLRQEQRPLPIYALVVDKGGVKMTRPEKPRGWTTVGRNGSERTLRIDGESMKEIVEAIGNFLDRPLLDQTGLEGPYDFDIAFSDQDDPNSTGASIFTVVREKLGLKIEPRRENVAVYVIDKLERPSEN
jgi:uncharacterized protein (TIGR03435 family)